jgi:hypothetical protein
VSFQERALWEVPRKAESVLVLEAHINKEE